MPSNSNTTPSTLPVVDPSTDPTPGEVLEWGDEYDSGSEFDSGSYYSDSEEDEEPAPEHTHTHDEEGGCGGHATSSPDDDHDGFEVPEEAAIDWLRKSASRGLQNLITSGQSGNRKGWRIGKGNNPTNFYVSLREALASLRRPVNLTICRQDGVVVDKRYIVQYLKDNHPIERKVTTIECRNCGDQVNDIVAHLKATNCARKATATNAKVAKVCQKVTGTPGKSTRRPQHGAKSGNPSHQHKHQHNGPARQQRPTKCKYCGCLTRNIRQHLLDNNCRFKAEQVVHEEEERQRASKPRRSKTSPKGSSTSRLPKGKAQVTFTTSANGFAGLKRKTTNL